MGRQIGRRRRWLLLLVGGVVVSAGFVALFWGLRERFEGWLERQIADSLRGWCAVSEVEVHWLPLQLAAHKLACDGPLTAVEEIRFIPQVGASLRNLELRVSVQLLGPQVDLRVAEHGASEPPNGSERRWLFLAAAPRVIATIEAEHLRLRFGYFDSSDVEVAAERAEATVVFLPGDDKGHAELQGGGVAWRRGASAVEAVKLSAALGWDSGGWNLERAEVRGPALLLVASSKKGVGTRFRVRAPMDAVAAFVPLPGGFAGELSLRGTLKGDLADPDLTVSLSLVEARLPGLPTSRWFAEVARREHLVRVAGLRGATDSAEVSGEGELLFGEGAFVQTFLEFRCADTTTCAGVYLAPAAPVARAIAGELSLVGMIEPLALSWAGRGRLEFGEVLAAGKQSSAWTLSGQLAAGNLDLEAKIADGREAALQAAFASGEEVSFSVTARSPDVGAWLQVTAPRMAQAAERWRAELAVRGRLDRASSVWGVDVSGRAGASAGTAGAHWNCKVSGHGSAWGAEGCRVDLGFGGSLSVERIEAEDWIHLQRVSAEARQLSLEPLWVMAFGPGGGRPFIGGVADGRLEWPVMRQERFTVRDLFVAGEPIPRLTIEYAPAEGALAQVRVEAEHRDAGHLLVAGKVGPRFEGHVQIDARGWNLAGLRALENAGAEGTLDVSGEVFVGWPPRGGTIRSEVRGAVLRGWEIGDVQGQVELDPKGWRIEVGALRDQVRMRGLLEPKPPFGFSARAQFAVHEWPPLTRRGLGIRTEGFLAADGRLQTGELQRAEWELGQFDLVVGRQHVRILGPARGLYESGRIALEDWRFEVPGGEANLSVALTRDGELSCRVISESDLGWISALLPQVVVGGRGRLNLELSHRSDRGWSARGEARFVDVSIEREDFPPASQVEITVRMEKREIAEVHAAGSLGRGRFEVQGQVDLGVGPTLDWQINDVELEALGGWEAVLDGRGALRGAWSQLELTGEVVVERAEYANDVELSDLLDWLRARWFSRERAPERPGARMAGAPVRVNVIVYSTGGVTIRNNLADVDFWIDLWLTGPLATPHVGGRIGVLGGKVSFQGRSFEVVGYQVEFRDGATPGPWLQIAAETEVRTAGNEYLITATVEGPANAPVVRFAADDPSLSEADILSLIVFGRTRSQLQTAGTSVNPLGVALGLVPTSVVERPVTRWLGVDRFEVSAAQGRETASLEPRFTVGKAITDQLYASLATIVGFQSRQIVQLEYRVAQRVSLLGSWESGTTEAAGAFGGDIKFRIDSYRSPFSLCN
jgi:hypothetical protein